MPTAPRRCRETGSRLSRFSEERLQDQRIGRCWSSFCECDRSGEIVIRDMFSARESLAYAMPRLPSGVLVKKMLYARSSPMESRYQMSRFPGVGKPSVRLNSPQTAHEKFGFTPVLSSTKFGLRSTTVAKTSSVTSCASPSLKTIDSPSTTSCPSLRKTFDAGSSGTRT